MTPTSEARPSPVLPIYQNPDYVAGLVQQLFDAPLVTTEVREGASNHDERTNVEGGGKVEASLKAGLPGAGSVQVGGTSGATGAQGFAVSTSSRSSQSFVYSQAYYLNLVRRVLREQGLIRPISDQATVEALSVGDFVEFTASFSAPAIPAIMDVLTPELVGAITRAQVRKSGRDEIDFSDFEGIKGAAAELDMRADSAADLAEAVTRAAQADFRQTKTREYYGALDEVSDVTAVTICDANRFVVEDEDRILDGSFTVLGKVSSLARKSMPVFERNKLLSNLTPEAVDSLLDKARTALEKTNAADALHAEDVDQLMDVPLHSRVPGVAFRVLPIAIYV